MTDLADGVDFQMPQKTVPARSRRRRKRVIGGLLLAIPAGALLTLLLIGLSNEPYKVRTSADIVAVSDCRLEEHEGTTSRYCSLDIEFQAEGRTVRTTLEDLPEGVVQHGPQGDYVNITYNSRSGYVFQGHENPRVIATVLSIIIGILALVTLGGLALVVKGIRNRPPRPGKLIRVRQDGRVLVYRMGKNGSATFKAQRFLLQEYREDGRPIPPSRWLWIEWSWVEVSPEQLRIHKGLGGWLLRGRVPLSSLASVSRPPKAEAPLISFSASTHQGEIELDFDPPARLRRWGFPWRTRTLRLDLVDKTGLLESLPSRPKLPPEPEPEVVEQEAGKKPQGLLGASRAVWSRPSLGYVWWALIGFGIVFARAGFSLRRIPLALSDLVGYVLILAFLVMAFIVLLDLIRLLQNRGGAAWATLGKHILWAVGILTAGVVMELLGLPLPE